jgi:hypothetical protein
MTMDNPGEEQAMEEDQNYVGAIDDVDHIMMESLFDLSAYTSDDDGRNDDESNGSSTVPSSSSQLHFTIPHSFSNLYWNLEAVYVQQPGIGNCDGPSLANMCRSCLHTRHH